MAMHPRCPAGPRFPTALHLASKIKQDPVGFQESLRAQWGDVVLVKAPPARPIAWVFEPDAIEHILVTNQKLYEKGSLTQMVSRIIGANTLFADGDEWRRRRRLIQPAFHRKRLEPMAALIADSAARLVERWQRRLGASGLRDEIQLDATAEMTAVTFEIAGWLFFGINLRRDATEFGAALEVLFKFVGEIPSRLVPLPLWVPTRSHRRVRQAQRIVGDVIQRIIDARRAGNGEAADLLSLLLGAHDEESNTRFTDRELRDEIFGLLIGGHETTALALTWALHLISKHPDVQARLHDEIEQALSGRSPVLADLDRLPYTRAVVDEVLRLYPPLPNLVRENKDVDEIGPYHMPARTLTLPSALVTHRHPGFWDAPARFEPDRFTPECARGRHRMAYFPFGGGPRVCAGRELALLEAQLILAALLQRFELRPQPGHVVKPDLLATLRPAGRLPIRVRARQR